MRNGADPLLVSALRAGVSHGYKRSETSPVALPRTISPSASYEWPEFLSKTAWVSNYTIKIKL